jgi:hypothetical protein
MRDPELRDALAALRADADGEGGAGVDAVATRGRVLESLERRGARHRTQLAFTTVLALSLLGTAAWGWASGWLPAALDQVRGVVPARLEPGAASAASAASERGVVTDVPDVPDVTPPPPPAPVPVPVRHIEAPPPHVVTAPPLTDAPSAVPEPPPAPAPEAAPDPELRAFRTAHEAHFHGDDPARALAAWDAYLAAYPDGKLSLEARWNRAVLLVRLGRAADARLALTPFATGAEHGYRQREAADLLARLPQR